MGLGLVIIWVGIPVLLIVAGAWWLFGAFERVQAKYLLGADVPPPPRSWESANGVWGKLKAHFGSAATWKDLLYLFAKLVFGTVSTTLLLTLAGALAWCVALPVAAIWRIDVVTTSAGSWHPPIWAGLLGIPAGILVFFCGLHVINGWGWVCRIWAEVMFGKASAAAALPAAPSASVTAPPARGTITPLVSVSAPPPAPPRPPSPPVPPLPQAPPPGRAPAVPFAPPRPPAPPAPPEALVPVQIPATAPSPPPALSTGQEHLASALDSAAPAASDAAGTPDPETT